MRSVIASSAALLFGFGILQLGDGLQGTLLGLRASLEGFPTPVTGVVMSMFYVGFLGGCLYAGKLIERVGHIRVFGALASVASAAVLIHGVFVNPGVWGLLRFLSGFCFAGLYIVAESWLNARADNNTRGQLLSVYMIVTYLSVGGGQLLLNLAPPTGLELFILTSVLISVALVPLLLSAGPAPKFEESLSVTVRQMIAFSPLGTFGAFATGMASGALFGMGPVFAGVAGLDVRETSVFMAALVLGAVLLQWPIGRLSDKLDRRRVLSVVAFLAVAAAVALPFTMDLSVMALVVGISLFGGLSIPLYALCIAHANDYLQPEQIVGASAALVLVNGAGAALGPVTVSAAMAIGGANGFFWSLAAMHAAVGLFAVYRMFRRPARPLREQGPYAPTAPQRSPVAVEWSQHAVRQQAEDTPDELQES